MGVTSLRHLLRTTTSSLISLGSIGSYRARWYLASDPWDLHCRNPIQQHLSRLRNDPIGISTSYRRLGTSIVCAINPARTQTEPGAKYSGVHPGKLDILHR